MYPENKQFKKIQKNPFYEKKLKSFQNEHLISSILKKFKKKTSLNKK